jgi:hypothetical protein
MPRDLPAGQIDGERMDRLAWRSAREQPLPGMGALPIVVDGDLNPRKYGGGQKVGTEFAVKPS